MRIFPRQIKASHRIEKQRQEEGHLGVSRSTGIKVFYPNDPYAAVSDAFAQEVY